MSYMFKPKVYNMQH